MTDIKLYLTHLIIIISLFTSSALAQNPDTVSILKNEALIIKLEQKMPDSALQLLPQIFDDSRKIGFTKGLIFSLIETGNIYFIKGEYEKSLSRYRQALPYCDRSPAGLLFTAKLYYNISNVFYTRGNYDSAAQYCYKSMFLAEMFPAIIPGGRIYSNLGILMNRMGQPDKALYYLDKAAKAAGREKNYLLMAGILENKGFIYSHKKDTEKALGYFNAALKIAREHQFTEIEFITLTDIGTHYIGLDSAAKALPYLQTALRMHDQFLPEDLNTQSLFLSLGRAYYMLHDYDAAEKYLQLASDAKEASSLKDNQMQLQEILSLIYARKSNYEAAYKHLMNFNKLKDSIEGKDLTQNINQLEIKYRTAEKDKTLAQNQLLIAQQENSLKEKNSWIVIIIGCLLLLTTLLVARYRNVQQKQKLQTEKLLNLQRTQEIMMLRATMQGEEKERERLAGELHDGVGGMLAAVKMGYETLGLENNLSSQPGYTRVWKMLQEMGKDIRDAAHNLMPGVLLHNSLPEAVRLFCATVNENKSLHIDVQAYGDFQSFSEDFKLFSYRIIQELVQNTIKHANASKMLVQLISDNGLFSITAEDNGRGITDTNHHSGQGLLHLQSRIQSMSGQLSIESFEGKGTTVYIEFDLPGVNATTTL
ncbi:tetratricopeptide repeat-containing sensor histidine kinase [Taibaiella soli]|uniref:Histidine kinase domain-containing protein n=1 Tax=Taibaiella soli TaxID=1649169 RepID=A0A2W2BEG5_9BACT|nr:tetratricopeptide repeat protein [Taibaiella soli]PZF71986.1 hypothetical protein DN068_15235 [Taibaiella soli]